ncbi:MAG: hypothetical protein ACR2KT_03790 [Methylocella sp.]|nr:MAG: hypothetical protein DLM68_03435 [Hyphomicrobiales bacterium]
MAKSSEQEYIPFWNDTLYLEGSVYQNLSRQALEVLGEPGIGDLSIDGAAPYWRAALEFNYDEHSLEIGTFGLAANLLPGRVTGFAFDQILDIGFDAQYQYIGNPHIITAKITHINEQQHLYSSFLQGLSSNPYNTFETFRASLGYVYDHTISLTAAYFSVYGSADALLFGATSLANKRPGAHIRCRLFAVQQWRAIGMALGECPHWRILYPLSAALRGGQ